MKSFLKKYKDKFTFAFEGLFYSLKHDRSVQLQFLIAVFVFVVCYLLKLNALEWILVVICVFSVVAVELINSAIEEIVDFISPDIHHKAKQIKDVSASAVLVVSIMALIVGLLIIGGKLL